VARLPGQIQQLGDGRDPIMNDHFFVTLLSDNSAEYYPNNIVARFVTKLPETIRLQGQYEMALVEIIYPHNWYNVSDGNKDNYWIAAANKDTMQKVYLSPGYYEDGSALVEALNFAQDIGVKFSFNRASGRFSLNFHSTGSHTMRMSDDLQSFMGFEDLQKRSTEAHLCPATLRARGAARIRHDRDCHI
jgi:hypothetical protein